MSRFPATLIRQVEGIAAANCCPVLDMQSIFLFFFLTTRIIWQLPCGDRGTMVRQR